MSIRIGASCVLTKPMVYGKVAEVRILYGWQDKWIEIMKYCLDNKIFFIINPCVNDKNGNSRIPTIEEWKLQIARICDIMFVNKCNIYNSKITLINEPTKWFRYNGGVSKLTEYLNTATSIIKDYKFRVGIGNMEFYDAMVLGDWYGYICENVQNYTDIDIHIQDSCDNEERCDRYVGYARSLADKYRKNLDCTEAFCTRWDIRTSSGYNNLLMQLKYAKKYSCENFCSVFINFDSNAPLKPEWKKLSFLVDRKINSGYWTDYQKIIEENSPKPNIQIIEEVNNMKLYVLKRGVKGNFVAWLQEILEIEYGFKNDGGWDGIFGAKTEEQVKQYQQANGLKVDGIVGKYTTADLILKSSKPDYWLTKLQIYIGFEK